MLKNIKKMLFTLCFVLIILINGCSPKNGLHKEGENTYYYKDGEKLYGWIQIDNDWYYSEVEGYKGIIKSTRLQDEKAGAYYYFDKDGKMITDKIVEGMYFGADGKQVFNSVIEKDGNSYVIDDEGIAKKMPDYQLVWDTKLPKTFRTGKIYFKDIIIDKISYKVENMFDYKGFAIYFSGEAGNCYDGPNYSVTRSVGFKIYDPDNIPVYSGDFTTDSALAMGEKFIENCEKTWGIRLTKKGIYRLVLLGID